jgi:hypothetical protein
MLAAVADYADDVRGHRFPAAEHTFSIDPGELDEFLAGVGEQLHECGSRDVRSRAPDRG